MSKKSKQKNHRGGSGNGSGPKFTNAGKNIVPNPNLGQSAMTKGVNAMKPLVEDKALSTMVQQLKLAQSGMNWGDVDSLYHVLASGLMTFAEALARNQKFVQASGHADPAFHRLVLTGLNDTRVFSEQLLAIKKKHEGKKGTILIDDLPLYYEVGGEYGQLSAKFSNLSFQIGQEMTTYNSEIVTKANPENNLQTIVERALAGKTDTPSSSAK